MKQYRHRGVERRRLPGGRILLGAALLAAMLAGAGATAAADEFRIASWRITDLWHEPGRALRTSAGKASTIRNEADFRQLRAAGQQLDADIVALQSVGSPQAVRRVFPAGQYHLVFSRQLRDRFLADTRTLSESRLRATYAAVVVRRSRGIRVRYVEQLATGSDGAAAGLAVELQIKDRTVWLLTAELPSGCTLAQASQEDAARCPGLARTSSVLRSWIDARRAHNQTYIVAASMAPVAGQAAGPGSIWPTLDGTAAPVSVPATAPAVVAAPQPILPGSEPALMKPDGVSDPLIDPSRSLDPKPASEPTGVSLTDAVRNVLEAVGEAFDLAGPQTPPPVATAGPRPQLALVHDEAAAAGATTPVVVSGPAAIAARPIDLANVETGERLARFPGAALTAPCATAGSALSSPLSTELFLFDRKLVTAPALTGFGAMALITGAEASATGDAAAEAPSCAVFVTLRL